MLSTSLHLECYVWVMEATDFCNSKRSWFDLLEKTLYDKLLIFQQRFHSF